MLPPRLPDWPERLAAFVEARRHEPFAWGRNDCVTCAFDALEAMTGTDALGVLRGSWRTEAEAHAVLARMGGLPMAAWKTLGQPCQRAAQAARGAVVCARAAAGHRATLGVLLGRHWCAPGAAGLAFRPAAEARLAWTWKG